MAAIESGGRIFHSLVSAESGINQSDVVSSGPAASSGQFSGRSASSSSEGRDMIAAGASEAGESDNRVKESAIYVETSLDDLSFCGSSSESSCDAAEVREIGNRTGSGQSEDEENERRLLAQLQAEHRNKLRAQQQRQQLEAQGSSSFRQQEGHRESKDDEERAPEVPVRRSSRQQERQRHPQPQPEPPMIPAAQRQQRRRLDPPAQASFDPRRELPRPLLVEVEPAPAALNPESRRSRVTVDSGKRRAISRPTQPPPPPPSLPPSLPVDKPRVPQRPRQKEAPKNIWSPSSSSVTTSVGSPTAPSSSLSPDEQPALHEPPPPVLPQQVQQLAATVKATQHQRRALAELSSPASSQNTIVEKRRSSRPLDEQTDEPAGDSGRPGEQPLRADAGEGACDEGGARNHQEEKTNHTASDGNNYDGNQEPGVSPLAEPSERRPTRNGESRQGESLVGGAAAASEFAAGKPTAMTTAGWRSMSVSLKRGSDDATPAGLPVFRTSGGASSSSSLPRSMAVRQMTTGGVVGGGNRSTNLRSLSIATSTLPASVAIHRQQQRQQRGEQQPESDGKHWTQPSGNAAAAAPDTAQHQPMAATSSEAAKLERPAQQPDSQQQQEQLYSISSKRKSADVSARQMRPKHKQEDNDRQSGDQDDDDDDVEQIRGQSEMAQGLQQQQQQQGEESTSSSLARDKREQEQVQTTTSNSARDEWFRHMYKQMHRPTAENTLLKAVNEQPPDSRDHFEIKLKSPRKDHRFSPTYYASEGDFERRHERNSVSPTFKPGNISDYLPGQSSISQHERNLILYHKLIEHIDRVFSSVLTSAHSTGAQQYHSRSTNTLQQAASSASHHQQQRPARKSHQQLYSRSLRRQQLSKSGPQTPVGSFRDQTSSLNRNQIKTHRSNEIHYQHHRHQRRTTRPLKGPPGYGNDDDDDDDNDDDDDEGSSSHEKRCVFNRLLKQPDLRQRPGQTNDHHCQHALDAADPRKQYLAVQQGHDIPLKGLGKPAPQPNIYKVGPIPPPISLHRHDEDGRLLSTAEAQRVYREHLSRLNELQPAPPIRRQPNSTIASSIATTSSISSSSLNGNHAKGNHQAQEENDDNVYRDFESIYESMRRQRPSPALAQPAQPRAGSGKVPLQPMLGQAAAFETEQLARSLAQVEEALQRARSPLPVDSPSSICGSAGGKLISVSSSRIDSALADHRPSTANAAPALGPPLSPMLSIETSSEMTTRADSRNTNQSYQMGPALVEEMTLSDLEDEISLSLMETSQQRMRHQQKHRYLVDAKDGQQLMRGSRSRNLLPASVSLRMSQRQLPAPTNSDQLFSDESINIHYRAPTSKLLLKMNTFNEFELNRIKKFYNDELASRLLMRSKSSRIPGGDRSSQGGSSGDSSSVSPARPVPAAGRSGSRSADRLHHPLAATAQSPVPVGVDLNRYQRAFLTKRAPSAGLRAGSNLQQLRKSVARFGRTLFDFQAKNERELSLRRGDLVEMLEMLDHNWARVEDCQSGLQGLVPLSYIDYSVGCAVAKRDVSGQQQVGGSQPQEAPLLPMSKGEPITLIRRLSGHWYEASNTRQANGLVWSNDLDIIKQPVLAAPAPAPTPEVGSPSPGGRRRQDSFTTDEEDEDEEMLILDTGERVLAPGGRHRDQTRAKSAAAASRGTAAIDPADRPCACGACACTTTPNYQLQQQQQLAAAESASAFRTLQNPSGSQAMRRPRRSSSSPYISADAAGSGRQHLPRLCRAKFAYRPRQEDELELVVGDILMVVHECDDGWFTGTSYSSKKTGTFPGNFVESIP